MALSGALEDTLVSSRVRGKGGVRAGDQERKHLECSVLRKRVGVGHAWEVSYRCVALEPWAGDTDKIWSVLNTEHRMVGIFPCRGLLLDSSRQSPMPLVGDTVAGLVCMIPSERRARWGIKLTNQEEVASCHWRSFPQWTRMMQ